MPTLSGAIADDFTGATDLAGLLAKSGVRVSLRMGQPAQPLVEAAPIEIIALKRRTVPTADAVDQALVALRSRSIWQADGPDTGSISRPRAKRRASPRRR